MSERLPIRFSDRTWNLIDAAATAEGITPASWVRRLVEHDLEGKTPYCVDCGAYLSADEAHAWRCPRHPERNASVDPLQPRGGLQSPRAEGEAIREAMLKWSGRQRP